MFALRCVALCCAQSNGVLSCCSAACNALHNILTWRAAIKRQLLTNDYLLVRHTGQSRGESLLHLYMLYVWGDIVHSSKSDCSLGFAMHDVYDLQQTTYLIIRTFVGPLSSFLLSVPAGDHGLKNPSTRPVARRSPAGLACSQHTAGLKRLRPSNAFHVFYSTCMPGPVNPKPGAAQLCRTYTGWRWCCKERSFGLSPKCPV